MTEVNIALASGNFHYVSAFKPDLAFWTVINIVHGKQLEYVIVTQPILHCIHILSGTS